MRAGPDGYRDRLDVPDRPQTVRDVDEAHAPGAADSHSGIGCDHRKRSEARSQFEGRSLDGLEGTAEDHRRAVTPLCRLLPSPPRVQSRVRPEARGRPAQGSRRANRRKVDRRSPITGIHEVDLGRGRALCHLVDASCARSCPDGARSRLRDAPRLEHRLERRARARRSSHPRCKPAEPVCAARHVRGRRVRPLRPANPECHIHPPPPWVAELP